MNVLNATSVPIFQYKNARKIGFKKCYYTIGLFQLLQRKICKGNRWNQNCIYFHIPCWIRTRPKRIYSQAKKVDASSWKKKLLKSFMNSSSSGKRLRVTCFLWKHEKYSSRVATDKPQLPAQNVARFTSSGVLG